MKTLKGLDLSFFILFLVIFFALISCTRAPETSSLKVSIPAVGAQSFESMKMAILNIKAPGHPIIYKSFEYNESPISGSFTLQILDVPKVSGMLVQFLGVYEDAANPGMVFRYGDVTVNTTNGGDIAANINAAVAGVATKQGTVSGRVLTTSGANSIADAGPTGKMTGYYQPANGRPPMAVTTADIYNGWFTAFFLEGATDEVVITYKIGEDVIIKGRLNSTTGNLGYSQTGIRKVVNIDIPTYERISWQNNVADIEIEKASHNVMGFFKKEGVSNIDFTSFNSCYYTTTEWIPGLFLDASSDPKLPLAYQENGTANTDIIISSAGSSGSLETLSNVTNPANNCYLGHARKPLIFNHFALNEGKEDFAGIHPPFQKVLPFSHTSGFVSKKFVSAGSDIELEWSLLPGAQSSISGFDIYKKVYSSNNYPNSSNDDEENKTCDQRLYEDGYVFETSLSNSSTNYIYDDGSVTVSNYNNYGFGVCPFRVVSGSKIYAKEAVVSDHCTKNCYEQTSPFGWMKVTDTTISTLTTFSQTISYDIRVTDTDTTDSYYTKVIVDGDADSETGWASDLIGHEVLFRVIGEKNTNDCGNFQDSDIKPGYGESSRVLQSHIDSGNHVILIPKGSFLDAIDITYLNASATSANFCFVQAVKVPHYKNLTMTGTLVTENFDYSTGLGGIIAFRVAQTFTQSGQISASNNGFAGGSNNYYGAGVQGNFNASSATGTGGGPSTGTGGGGFGNGGDSSSSIGEGSNDGDNTPFRFLMGGGGGATASSAAQSGGGTIFITTRKSNITASTNAAGAIANAGTAGGSGGGSISFRTSSLTTNASALMSVAGGDGLGNGSGGGGGYMHIVACESISPFVVGDLNYAAGAGAGTGINGYEGDYDIWSSLDVGADYFCKYAN